MKTIPLQEDRWRVFLDNTEYRELLQSAYEPPSRSAQEVRLEMRFMALSLRVDTASDVQYKQFEKRETTEGDYWIVKVQGKDSTEREAETRPRAVFVPGEIMDEVHQHADRHNISDDDQLFKVSTRTIQRDVKRSAGNAAVAVGDEEFRKVSPHDLRRYFATHLLYRHEVPPPVVRVLGGWKSDESMFEYLILPDDVLYERLADANILGTAYDKLQRHDQESKIAATTDRLAELVNNADHDVVEGAARDVASVFDSVEQITLNVETETETATPGHTDDDSYNEIQSSFNRFGSDRASISIGAAAKVTHVIYVLMVVWVAWSTFGPLS